MDTKSLTLRLVCTNLHKTNVFISYSCCNIWPKTCGLKQQIYYLLVLEFKWLKKGLLGLKSRCQQSCTSKVYTTFQETHKTKNRLWANQFQRIGAIKGNAKLMFNGHRGSVVWNDRNILEMDGGQNDTTMWVYLMPLTCTLKMVKTVINFILCIFTTVVKKRNESLICYNMDDP